MRLPQSGEPGPSIYIPQEQGVPVIPPGTWFPVITSGRENQKGLDIKTLTDRQS
jgi:hypothetical protein